jgi:hypothetical protein
LRYCRLIIGRDFRYSYLLFLGPLNRIRLYTNDLAVVQRRLAMFLQIFIGLMGHCSQSYPLLLEDRCNSPITRELEEQRHGSEVTPPPHRGFIALPSLCVVEEIGLNLVISPVEVF